MHMCTLFPFILLAKASNTLHLSHLWVLSCSVLLAGMPLSPSLSNEPISKCFFPDILHVPKQCWWLPLRAPHRSVLWFYNYSGICIYNCRAFCNAQAHTRCSVNTCWVDVWIDKWMMEDGEGKRSLFNSFCLGPSSLQHFSVITRSANTHWREWVLEFCRIMLIAIVHVWV